MPRKNFKQDMIDKNETIFSSERSHVEDYGNRHLYFTFYRIMKHS